MQSSAATPQEYVDSLPDDRKAIIEELRTAILKNLPDGFEEVMNYGMLGYVVPHSLYPAGYHCDPKLPLPFMSLASQKHFIAVYHMGLYADENVMKWFTEAFAKASKKKLDMGKSCVRFKKSEDVPVALIGKLASKFTVKQCIKLYEGQYRDQRKKS